MVTIVIVTTVIKKIEAALRACSHSEELMRASLFSRSIAALRIENYASNLLKTFILFYVPQKAAIEREES